LPLLGKNILFTTPRNYAATLGALLVYHGARPVWMPAIEIWPLPDHAELDRAIRGLSGYDWVTFTSENGIRAFGERANALKIDARAVRGTKFVTYQPDAPVLQEYGFDVSLTPEEQSPESIVTCLAQRGVTGGKLLAIVPEVVGVEEPYGVGKYLDNLRKLGLAVDQVAGYQNVAVTPARVKTEMRMLLKGEIDAVIFTYSGEILAAKKLLGNRWPELNKTAVAYKGPFTAENGRKAGLKTDIVPDNYTMFGIIEALELYFSKQHGEEA